MMAQGFNELAEQIITDLKQGERFNSAKMLKKLGRIEAKLTAKFGSTEWRRCTLSRIEDSYSLDFRGPNEHEWFNVHWFTDEEFSQADCSEVEVELRKALRAWQAAQEDFPVVAANQEPDSIPAWIDAIKREIESQSTCEVTQLAALVMQSFTSAVTACHSSWSNPQKTIAAILLADEKIQDLQAFQYWPVQDDAVVFSHYRQAGISSLEVASKFSHAAFGALQQAKLQFKTFDITTIPIDQLCSEFELTLNKAIGHSTWPAGTLYRDAELLGLKVARELDQARSNFQAQQRDKYRATVCEIGLNPDKKDGRLLAAMLTFELNRKVRVEDLYEVDRTIWMRGQLPDWGTANTRLKRLKERLPKPALGKFYPTIHETEPYAFTWIKKPKS